MSSEKAKKIVHLVWSFGTGGIQVMVADMVNRQSVDHQVLLLIINRNPTETLLARVSDRVKVHRLERKRGRFTPLKYIWINLIIHFFRPDAIHCHIPDQARLLFFIKRKKLCLTLHDVNKDLKDIHLYGKIFSISKSVQEDLRKRAGLDSRVIYNGIDLSGIRVKEWKPQETFRIVILSRLIHEKKGQDVFIRALSQLVRSREGKEIHATIIGDGDSMHFLKTLTDDLGLAQHISFPGTMERKYIQEELRNFDLLVQPSRYEGFGITVIEGMAAGLPVLVSDVDGPMEIIQEGKYGSFFKSGDETDCALKIREIIEQSGKTEFRERVEEARVYVNENFSIESTSRNYCEGYFND